MFRFRFWEYVLISIVMGISTVVTVVRLMAP